MDKFMLVGTTDIEKMNTSELINIKGGANSFAEDSEHHDSNNNDTFNTGTENPDSNPQN